MSLSRCPPNRQQANPPEQFLAIGTGLARSGRGEAARELVAEALAAFPGNGLYRELGRQILSQGMYDFHTGMLHDQRRNGLYCQAIERVAKDRVVLDIGTGSGLLAMMAARAGAARVIACEATPTMAATARAIIAANGLADRITVHNCHSTKLDRERDLHGGADMVVSEVFASDVVCEAVQPSLEHARTQLCTDYALFVPPAAEACVALACDPYYPGTIGTVEGFDLSALNDHLSPMRRIHPWDADIGLRSAPADLFAFTYRSGEPIPQVGQAEVRLAATTSGPVTGVVQWLRLTFADDLIYENAPTSERGMHWELFYHPFDRPRDMVAGEQITVRGFYTGTTMAVWAD